jgi:DNA-binding CsgD family transcriptional regulator
VDHGPLLEREGELQALEEVLAGARNGSGRTLIVEGAVGIGKTALIESAHRQAAALGLLVRAARGSELERDFPFGVVRQLLEPTVMAASQTDREELFRGAASGARRVLGDAAAEAVEPGAEASFSILNGLHWVVAGLADRHPIALVIDDLHWADTSSLRLLAFLAQRIDDLPCAIVGASRPREDEASEAFLGELRAIPTVEFIHPRAFSEGAVATLVKERLGTRPADEFAAACRESTAGNPLLVSELVRAIAEAGISPSAEEAGRVDELAPESVADYVTRHLERLGDDATGLAQAASVLGDPAPLALAGELADVRDRDAPLAHRLREIEILTSEDPIRFRHPLVRRAIHDSLSLDARDRLNRAAMEHFRSVAGDRDRAAAHALATRPGRAEPATLELLRRAAGDALARGAPEAAINHLCRALEEPPPPKERWAVLLELGLAQRQAGKLAAADTFRAALQATSSERERAHIAFELGHTYQLALDWAAAIEAFEMASLSNDDPLVVRIQAELLMSAMYLPAAADTALPRIEFLERHRGTAVADQAVAAAAATAYLLSGDRAGATERAEAGLAGELFPSDGFLTTFNAIAVLWHCEEYDSMLAHIERGFDSQRATAIAWSLSALHYIRGWHSLSTGTPEAAIADFQVAKQINETLDWGARASFYSHTGIATAAAELGNFELAEDELAALGADSGWSEIEKVFALSARGAVREHHGMLSEALQDLLDGQNEVDGLAIEYGSWPPTFLFRARAALILGKLGERDQALQLARAELEAARRLGGPRLRAVSMRALGTVEGGEAGLSLLSDAVEISETSQALLERIRCLIALGGALRRLGRRSDSRPPLRQALDMATAADIAPLATTAREELQASGGRPRRDRISGRDALTSSEERIARLAADGLSNREIAQTLYLSRKTVEMHLSRTYRKLDISSRDHIERALADPQPA